jgi:hypothetical protein
VGLLRWGMFADVKASRFAVLLQISGFSAQEVAYGQRIYMELESASSARVSKHMLGAYDYQEDEFFATRRVARMLEPLVLQLSGFPSLGAQDGHLAEALKETKSRVTLDALAEKLWESCRQVGLLG